MSQLVTRFRQTMSSLAAPVLLLTTPSFCGATLSSVTSLSISPAALVQFNLMKPSTTSTDLHKAARFALHVMPPVQESGILARKFGKNGTVRPDGVFVPVSPFEGLQQRVDYELKDVHGARVPILTNAERIMICEKFRVFEVQDHEIWIGKVIDVIEMNNDEKTGGLLNFDRSFHKVGDGL